MKLFDESEIDSKVDRVVDALIDVSSGPEIDGCEAVEAAAYFFIISIVANIDPEHQVAVLDKLVEHFRGQLPIVNEDVH